MFRLRQLVPTVAVSLAVFVSVTPAAQARPADVSVGSSPQSLPTRAFSPVHRGPAPGQSQDSPLKNQLSTPADAQTSVAASSTSGSFDWSAAAVGAIVASLLALVLAAGLNLRTRRMGDIAA